MNSPVGFSTWRRAPAALGALLLVSTFGTVAAATPGRLTVTSAAFADGATIPNVYAHKDCVSGAEDRSPALSWSGAPAGTKSFAITVFDPDAPTGHGFWHWILFDVPAGVHDLSAGAGASGSAPHGATLGRTDFGTSEYAGPCPPRGAAPHHYVFTVRALDIASVPDGSASMTGPQLVAAVKGHVLASGSLVGRFGRE